MATRFTQSVEYIRKASHNTNTFLERGHMRSWVARDIQMISGDVRRGCLNAGHLRKMEGRALLAVKDITDALARSKTEGPRLRALMEMYSRLLVALKRCTAPKAAIESKTMLAFSTGITDLTETGIKETIRDLESGKGFPNPDHVFADWMERETRKAIDHATYRAGCHERYANAAPKVLDAYGRLQAAIARKLQQEASK